MLLGGQLWRAQMQFTLTRNTPVSRYWKPKLVFTGTSIMGVNPANGAPVAAPLPALSTSCHCTAPSLECCSAAPLIGHQGPDEEKLLHLLQKSWQSHLLQLIRLWPRSELPQKQLRVNMPAGKFNRHIDIWDAVRNQQYFSFEAFQHVLAQLASVQRAPDLPGPAYTILKKWKDCEVRR
jgi:hypothetical protein